MKTTTIVMAVKVTVPDVEADTEAEAEELMKKDLESRFPIHWSARVVVA